MPIRGYTLLLLVGILLCSTCCGIPYMIYSAATPQRVVRPDEPASTQYVPDGIYGLRQAVFIINRPNNIVGDLTRHLIVIPGDESEGVSVPKSPAEYQSGPSKWPQVIAMLPAGQGLYFKDIRYVRTHGGTDVVFPGALVVPGYDYQWPHPLFVVMDSPRDLGLVDGVNLSRGADPDSDFLEYTPGNTTQP